MSVTSHSFAFAGHTAEVSHSPMVHMLRWNFLSPEFGTKFQREVPLFLEIP